MKPTTDNAVERLQRKIAREASQQALGRYFAVRILPVSLLWALLMAAAKVVAGGLISLGVDLTTYFSGAAVLVIWIENRARRHAAEG